MLRSRIAVHERLLDTLLIMIALQFSTSLRRLIDVGIPSEPAAFEIPWVLFRTAVVIWQVTFQLYKIYSTSKKLQTPTLNRMLQAYIVAIVLFWGVLYIMYCDFSRLQTLYFALVLIILIPIGRLTWSFVRNVFGHSATKYPKVIIMGNDAFAYEVGRAISDCSDEGAVLVGFVLHESEPIPEGTEGLLSTFDQLAAVIANHHIDEIIICVKFPDRSYLRRPTEFLLTLSVNVCLAPDYSELAYFHVSVENFGGLPLISLRYDMLTSGQRLVKRIFDIISASLLLTASLPFMLIIAAAIKFDSKGPIFFRQVRVGERGKLFMMYKFRTMIWDAKSKITYTHYYKHADDPRVTRVGRLLRCSSLDEIPQFFNVLKGDMTLVGPRPELPQIVQFYSLWQRKRFEVPQGITGWWQINGRADVPMYEAIDYDVFYIRNYSIWLDMQILVRTPLAILSGRGAF